MNPIPWLTAQLAAVQRFWQSLGSDMQTILWLAIGVLGLMTWAWAAHRVLRHLAGHHRFQGRWFNDADYRRLMQVLQEDQERGHRVMSSTELHALRQFKYGKAVKPLLAGRGGGYFDA